MFTKPAELPISLSGSSNTTILTATPDSLADYYNPVVTDPNLPIKFMIENILLTNPGERLSDPTFGVGLRGYIFEPFSSFSNLETRISRQLSSYISDITVLNVRVIEEPDTNAVFVSINYLDPIRNVQNYVVSTQAITNGGSSIYT